MKNTGEIWWPEVGIGVEVSPFIHKSAVIVGMFYEIRRNIFMHYGSVPDRPQLKGEGIGGV